MDIRVLNFLDNILLKKQISSFYAIITNTLSQTLFFKNSDKRISKLEDVCIINDVPEYLSTQVHPLSKLKKANMYHGYMINLSTYENIEAYLVSKFSAKRRSKNRTCKKKLELCFNIRYKMYYGDIPKKDYDYLFDQLRLMIEKRFITKQMKYHGWKKMDVYKELMYPMILEKKACLFVIYNNKEPISISLNLANKDIYTGFMMSFDIDFSKFYLGLISILKQIEWCFNNGFKTFDMMKGDLDYKKGFSDTIYRYQSHIIYPSSRFFYDTIANLIAFRIESYYRLLHLLKQWNIHLLYRRIKSYNILKQRGLSVIHQDFYIENMPNIVSDANLSKINIKIDNYAKLRAPIYTFLYSNPENVGNIEVFEVVNESSYLVKGKNKSILINYNS